MSGNVYEWCSDWYGKYNSSEQIEVDPTGPTSGTYRVVRGGSWLLVPKDNRLEPDYNKEFGYIYHNNNKRCCRVSYRAECISSGRYYAYGLRLVLVP